MNRRETIFSAIGGIFGISAVSSEKPATNKPVLNIKTASYQTPLAAWQTSTGKELAFIDANGNFFCKKQNG